MPQPSEDNTPDFVIACINDAHYQMCAGDISPEEFEEICDQMTEYKLRAAGL